MANLATHTFRSFAVSFQPNLKLHQLPELTESKLKGEIRRHEAERSRRSLLWSYYRNHLIQDAGSSRPLKLAQERGLPDRLTREAVFIPGSQVGGSREVVIENDIAWRVATMIDFLFGKPLSIHSVATDAQLAGQIENALTTVWHNSGGMGLLHDAAVLGHVYGSVQFVLDTVAATGSGHAVAAGLELASLRIRLVPPQRGVPIMAADDYRQLQALVIVYEPAAAGDLETTGNAGTVAESETTDDEGSGGTGSQSERSVRTGFTAGRLPTISQRVMRALGKRFGGAARGASVTGRLPLAPGSIVQVISATLTQWYEVGEDEEVSLLHQRVALCPGVLEAAHVQNVAVPLTHHGGSEVEQLIPLQNELNTRLSDRANRVTMQCFKMYLAKGIDGFDKVPVMPGTIWHTDNSLASIEAFGGDAASPSEESHIGEIREAMDKLSATPPLAAGVVRSKIGNLTSENALKVTLQGILSRTQRKRLTYGRGIVDISRAVLAALDYAGILPTEEADRGLELVWADPLPSGEAAARSARATEAPQVTQRGVKIE